MSTKRRSYEEIMADTMNAFVQSDAFKDTVRGIVKEEIANLNLDSKKKPSTPKGKPASDPKPQMTKKEAIAAWASKKYTEAERKAYGEQKRAERSKQKEAYEKANAFFTEKVDYKVWRAKYEEFLKA